jgi:hypothetical protein
MTHYTFKTPRHYKKSLVAYLDIIGFKKKIEKSSKSAEEADAIYQILRTHHRTTQIINKGKDAPYIELTKLKATSFSDNIVISLPIMNDKTFRSFIHLVTYFQWDTTDFNSFLRGAIVFGRICHTKEVVFGPAMVHAYELERKVSKWPRVIVDQELIDLLSEETRQFAFDYVLLRDETGLLFVDYLRYIYLTKLAEETDGTNKVPSYLTEEFVFRQHRQSIELALNEPRLVSRVLFAFYKLSTYHNDCIDRICREFQIDGYYPTLDEESKKRHIDILQSEKINLNDAFWRYHKFLQRHMPKTPEVINP